MTAGNRSWKPAGNHFLSHWNCSKWKKQAVPTIGRKFNGLGYSVSTGVSVAFRLISETLIPLAGYSDNGE